jgi:hypothetical protein
MQRPTGGLFFGRDKQRATTDPMPRVVSFEPIPQGLWFAADLLDSNRFRLCSRIRCLRGIEACPACCSGGDGLLGNPEPIARLSPISTGSIHRPRQRPGAGRESGRLQSSSRPGPLQRAGYQRLERVVQTMPIVRSSRQRSPARPGRLPIVGESARLGPRKGVASIRARSGPTEHRRRCCLRASSKRRPHCLARMETMATDLAVLPASTGDRSALSLLRDNARTNRLSLQASRSSEGGGSLLAGRAGSAWFRACGVA